MGVKYQFKPQMLLVRMTSNTCLAGTARYAALYTWRASPESSSWPRRIGQAYLRLSVQRRMGRGSIMRVRVGCPASSSYFLQFIALGATTWARTLQQMPCSMRSLSAVQLTELLLSH